MGKIIKTWGAVAAVLLAALLLVPVAFSASAQASVAKTSTGSVTSLLDLCRAKIKYSNFSTFKTSFKIPGLKSTRVGGESCTVMTPQGICVANDYILISAYCNCERNHSAKVHVEPGRDKPYHHSVIYVLDKSSGALRAVIQLPDRNHVGGIAFDGSVVWVAKSEDKNLSTISYSTIQQAVNATTNPATSTYVLENYLGNTVKLKSTASFVQCFDGYVWVGLYSKDSGQPGMLYRYSFSGANAGDPVLDASKTKEYSLDGSVTGGPSGKYANGVALSKVNGETRVIVNYSPGRFNDSTQALYSLGDSKLTYISKKILPPMLETSTVDGSNVYSLFESAATPYMNRVSAGKSGPCHYPVDTIQVKSVASTFGQSNGVTMTDINLYDENGNIVCKLSDLYGKSNVVCIVGRPTCGNTSYVVRQAREMLGDSRFNECIFVIMDTDDDSDAFYSGFSDYLGIDKKRLLFCSAPSSSSVSYNSWSWNMYYASSSMRAQSDGGELEAQSELTAAESITLPFIFMAKPGGETVSATTGPVDLASNVTEAFGLGAEGEGDGCALLDIKGSYVEAGQIDQILELTNEEREKAGSGAVAWNANLEKIAQVRAAELAVLYSHTRPDNSSVFDLELDGTSASAENIAAGYEVAVWAHNGWVNSSGHYRNMTNASYTSMGAAGFETENHQFYWVELFSTDGGVERDSSYSSEIITESVLTHSSNINFEGELGYVNHPGYYYNNELLNSGDSVKLVLGKSDTVTVFQSNGYGRTPLVSDTLIWESSDNNAVSVDESGGIVAKSLGEATITASCVDLPDAKLDLKIMVEKSEEAKSGSGWSGSGNDETDHADDWIETNEKQLEREGVQPMHRLYNPNSGEHFYTADDAEATGLAEIGWSDEGYGWTAPKWSNTPVYRLYNSVGGEHHYTFNAGERDLLIEAGWNDEGVGWYSDDTQTVPLFREYNPNAFANNHNYTTSSEEHDYLISIGWQDEGYAWYGV